MTYFDNFLIAWWIVGISLTVSQVGKPRKPLDSTSATIAVLINLGLIAALLLSRGVL